MAWVMVMGFCAACHKFIAFNPHRVPSLRIKGEREPICRACALRWQQLHPEQSAPILDGAYEEYEDGP